MIYRKGELSPAMIDRGWPHQVALPASASENGGYKCFRILRFSEAIDIEPFMKQFGGERFDPNQRGRGSNWARWKKPPTLPT
ncbi:MAG: hypothetical protein WB760_00155 [Xanthobacteraceae bacterium]